MDKLANMQAFATVGQTGSFTAAARRLNLSNSVVSKRIKDLEEHLGAQLLVRTTRQLSLTETGYNYLEYVRRFIDELEEVESLIRHKTEKPTGTIRLSAPLSFGMQYLGPAIASYLVKYPDVTINTYLSDRFVNLIDEGYDLSIRTGPLEDSSLVARKLVDCRRVVCASPDYLDEHGRPEKPEDLRSHNCLSYLNLADGKAWPFFIEGKKTWQTVDGSFHADNGELLHEAALNSCGITLLPTFIVADSLKSGQLEVVLEEFEQKDFNMFAVYQHRRHLSTKLRTLIDHLSECFQQSMTLQAFVKGRIRKL